MESVQATGSILAVTEQAENQHILQPYNTTWFTNSMAQIVKQD
jgi:hypothetical protein